MTFAASRTEHDVRAVIWIYAGMTGGFSGQIGRTNNHFFNRLYDPNELWYAAVDHPKWPLELKAFFLSSTTLCIDWRLA